MRAADGTATFELFDGKRILLLLADYLEESRRPSHHWTLRSSPAAASAQPAFSVATTVRPISNHGFSR